MYESYAAGQESYLSSHSTRQFGDDVLDIQEQIERYVEAAGR